MRSHFHVPFTKDYLLVGKNHSVYHKVYPKMWQNIKVPKIEFNVFFSFSGSRNSQWVPLCPSRIADCKNEAECSSRSNAQGWPSRKFIVVVVVVLIMLFINVVGCVLLMLVFFFMLFLSLLLLIMVMLLLHCCWCC